MLGASISQQHESQLAKLVAEEKTCWTCAREAASKAPGETMVHALMERLNTINITRQGLAAAACSNGVQRYGKPVNWENSCADYRC
jgi:hypothetical protein